MRICFKKSYSMSKNVKKMPKEHKNNYMEG